jgi:PPP family 3-phenylpropionic acid transporter
MSPAVRVGAFLVAIFIPAGIMTAFLPLWLADRGLSAAEIGQVLGISTVTRIVAMPAWGSLADRMGRRRPVLAWAGALAALGAIAYVPAHGFPALLAVAIVQGGSGSALMPLADALSLALSRAKRLDYGRVRAVGSAAFMAATALAGWAVGLWGIWLVPPMVALSNAVGVALTFTLPEVATAPAGPRGGGVVRLMTHRPFLLTLAASALIQGTHAAYYGLASLHWRAHGLSEFTIGLLWAEGVLAETLLFFFGGRVTRRMSPAALTATAATCCVLRWAVVGLTTDLAPLLAVQALHGATYGMQHLSAMLLLSRTVPPAQAGTAQTLHAALGAAVPVGILIWVVGNLYDGSGAVFTGMALLGALALPVAFGLRRYGLQAI